MALADWRDYDPVADAYAGVATAFYTQLANDLVEAVAPPFRSRVLDLGAGSGVAARAATAACGGEGLVVALDPSRRLLAHARSPAVPGVVGAAPDLPFGAGTFDVVVASLVLGHLDDPRPTLAELVRVLRPGGRLGLATWGRVDDGTEVDDDDERRAYAVWADVAARHVALDDVDDEVATALPWEAELADPDRLREILAAAGLRVVETVGRVYRTASPHDRWLARIDTGARARAVRARIGDDAYARLRAEVAAALGAAVPDPVLVADETVVTVATAPGTGAAA